MRKRRNRVYRRIAVALTVALLAGQSHAFVLAEEGDAPQTEITGEVDTDTSNHGNVTDGGNADNGDTDNGNTDNGNAGNGNTDNGNAGNGNAGNGNTGNGNTDNGNTDNGDTDNGNTDNGNIDNGSGGNTGGTDGQNPDDNGNQGDQQEDGDKQDTCICEKKCVEGTVDPNCPVCVVNYEACAGKADDAGNNGSENDDTENNDSENGGQDQCICETVCTEENVNVNCPVCAAGYTACAKNAGGGVNLSANVALPEMALASMADEEAGIDALADEGVEAYAIGHTFYYPENPADGEQRLQYTVINEVGATRGVNVVGLTNVAVSGRVDIPREVNGYNVTGIGRMAFVSCFDLTSITLSDSVTSIGDNAFCECVGLTSITIPDSVTSIGVAAFQQCKNLKSVEISNSMTSIAKGTFYNCEKLESVEIPSSVNQIGTEAFSDCKKLDTLQIIISSNGKYQFPTIGKDAFKGLPSSDQREGISFVKGPGVTDEQLAAADVENAFINATKSDGDTDDSTWYGWPYKGVVVKDTYHTVTFYDGTTPYGEDTPQKPQSVADGQKVNNPGDPEKAEWKFTGWKTADGAEYDFDTPVTSDTSIYASWVKQFIIKASTTEGGTIDPEGDIPVEQGGAQTFTITPNEGYRIKTVTVDGEAVTAELKDTRARAQAGAKDYTFTDVRENHTIHAEFESDGSSSGGGDNPGGGGDNPGGGGDNPGGGGDNPGGGGNSGGGDNGGGSGDGDHSNSNGGGNNGGGSNPDGGNSTDNTANADNGNGAGNGQAVAGTTVSSAQAGGGATTVSAGGNGTAADGKEPKTGDASYLEVYATLAMIAGLTYLLLYVMEESRGMSEREKEAFVAAFIRWGKKGGAFRKCCAMAAIFCLLAYYHIIGKNVGGNALREKHLGQAF